MERCHCCEATFRAFRCSVRTCEREQAQTDGDMLPVHGLLHGAFVWMRRTQSYRFFNIVLRHLPNCQQVWSPRETAQSPHLYVAFALFEALH